MTLTELNQIQAEADALGHQAKEWRKAGRQLAEARAVLTAGKGPEVLFSCRGIPTHIPGDLATDALAAVSKPLSADIYRAAEVHCQERARECFLRASLLIGQVDNVLNAGRHAIARGAGRAPSSARDGAHARLQ